MIEVQGLSKSFLARRNSGTKDRSLRVVNAVRDIHLSWSPGKFIAIVGESGCGKSTLGRMLSGTIRPSAGRMYWDGRDTRPRSRRTDKMWARMIQLIPQDPYAALNPVRSIRSTLAEPLLYHRLVTRRNLNDKLESLLDSVGLAAGQVLDKYPHQLSGGQRQRLVLARSLTVNPQYLVADEAVSMVDVSLRLGILASMREISQQRQLGLMFITHDFRVARYIAQDGMIAVMYLGRIVEWGPSEEILQQPLHPYTQALISAVPVLEGVEERVQEVIPKHYEVTESDARQTGCGFEPRCPFATEACRTTSPPLQPVSETAPVSQHRVACHHATARTLLALR